ncbi:5'-nucleotidase, lipoprotein e(P4) family [Variovorax sp.]|uniref:5'-nucleotidase, lipoprotein e(P4) family n=1 Tax=Variovorax sp. TaxID=1871043 RepID=UPI0025FD52AD|nr:HAD family acid phosphatase [Variovorax sp.]
MKPHSTSRRFAAIAGVTAALLLAAGCAQTQAPPAAAGAGTNNLLIGAVAWKQTAAEYRALYHQGFNVARMHVEAALKKRRPGDKPLAVVTDMDDTILLPLAYWGYLINEGQDFFDDPKWDAWIPKNQIVPSPGSQEFLRFCRENGVEVFYVTSREQGERTYEYAMEHLKVLGAPYADKEHLTVLRDSSNKQPRQEQIAQQFDVVVYLGDNLNDFRRKYYVKNVDQRIQAMEADREQFGRKYVLFPNPTDGHWMAAIFGDSEPPANDANRQLFRKAATRSAWDGH